MRLLANENFPLEAVLALQAEGHDVLWVHADSPGLPDAEVLARARAEGRVLITFDKDFGQLAFGAVLPPACGIILLRISAPSARNVAAAVTAVIKSRNDWVGNFAVVEDDRVRMRALPPTPVDE